MFRKIRKYLSVLFFIGIFILGFFYYQKQQEDLTVQEIGVEENHPLILYFQNQFPDREILKAKLVDIDEDGHEDLIVVYNISRDSSDYPTENRMRVLLNDGENIRLTTEEPAPIENQQIKINEKDHPITFTVSGSKRGNHGYAIYMIEDLKIINIYGEGMDKC